MMINWQKKIPELSNLREIEQVDIIKKAQAGSYTFSEVIILVVWMLFVLYFSKEVSAKSTLDNKLELSIIVNLIVVLPLLLIIYIPIYLRKMKRLINAELRLRFPNNDSHN
jgi:hypothetical protein